MRVLGYIVRPVIWVLETLFIAVVGSILVLLAFAVDFPSDGGGLGRFFVCVVIAFLAGLGAEGVCWLCDEALLGKRLFYGCVGLGVLVGAICERSATAKDSTDRPGAGE